MRVLGMEIATLQRFLDTLAVLAVIYFWFPGLVLTGSLIIVYIIVCTKYWLVALVYLFWLLSNTDWRAENGSRRNDWVCSWSIFKRAAKYFPVTFTTAPGFQLNPKKNYVAGVFPHGVISLGVFLGLQTNAIDVNKVLPKHTIIGATLNSFFRTPLMREALMIIGMCNAGSGTINNILSDPNGGKVVGIVVGGVAEAFQTCREQYHLVLKNRKGFVKLALKNGTAVIPVFSFGENRVCNIKTVSRKRFLIPLFIPYGRGFFESGIGMLPHRTPINIVAGLPIEVEKVENPTQQQIDDLHAIFVQKLTELFEEYKYKFEENPESVKLIIS